MSQQDTGLYKSFAIVLGALVLFTLFIIVIANIFSPPTDHSKDPLIASSVKRQIEPVGRSNVRAEEVAEVEQTESAASTETATAAVAVVKSEDTDDSSTQAEAGAETETTSGSGAAADDSAASASAADDGSNSTASAEPATADSSVDIPLKVRAVVATNCAGCHANGVKGAQRNDDTSAWQGLADKGLEALTASVINGVGEMPARAESNLDDAELQLAVQHMINKNLGGSGNAANSTTSSAAEDSDATAESAATAQSDEAPATEAPAADAMVIPDNVKAAVDTLCAACHVSGVGNAPKYGDKEAWAARMANGIDAVVASAIAGKGAMPARGGSQLTDEEIELAIHYMVSK